MDHSKNLSTEIVHFHVKVYEGSQVMEHLSPETVSGPALGLLISLYALTSGSAHFAARASSIGNRQGQYIKIC